MVQQHSTRIGSTYTVSGNNITAGTMGGLTKASGDRGLTHLQHKPKVHIPSQHRISFRLTESFVMGDSVNPIGTGVDVASGIVADMPATVVLLHSLEESQDHYWYYYISRCYDTNSGWSRYKCYRSVRFRD
ncbi:MAG: hypothetical protein CM15mV2_0680 [uncultured marine virus]|nr:MAG: hypothetical protein CM15mV2_0680 [uncultured marine virus]